MSLTKSKLGEFLNELTAEEVKELAKSKDVTRSGTKAELIARVVEAVPVKKEDIEQHIFANFDSIRFDCAVYSVNGKLELDKIEKKIANVAGVSNVKYSSEKKAIQGLLKVSLKVFPNFIPGETNTDNITEVQLKPLDLYYPFILTVHKGHLLVKVAFVINSSRFTSFDGSKFYVESNNYDILIFAEKIIGAILEGSKGLSFAGTDLTNGIRTLAKEQKIDAVRADCDDAKNEGVNSRKLHRNASKKFIDHSWYTDNDFFTTSRIYPNVWYYTNKDTSKKPEAYDRLKIDCSSGIITKSKKTDHDLNWFIHEIIEKN